MKKHLDGGITVFLSLVILVILALVGTVIESARVNVAKVYAERSLLTAMDSEFTEYQEKLYEDYHLFLLEKDLDIDSMGGDEFLASIQDYLLYSFEPNTELNLPGTNYNIPNMNLLDIQTENVTLIDSVTATDYNGELFLSEVTEYMKYQTGAKVAEVFLEKMNMLQKTKKTVAVVKEKLKVEKKLGELDKQVMDFMESVEGLTFKKSGLKYTNGGLIKAQETFAKKLCMENISCEAVGINHAVVWDSLKNEYINPLTKLKQIETAAKEIEAGQKDTKKVKDQIDEVKEIIKTYEEGTSGEDSAKKNNIETDSIETEKIETEKIETEDTKVKNEDLNYTEADIKEFKKKLIKLEKEYKEITEENEKKSSEAIKNIKSWGEEIATDTDPIIVDIEASLELIPEMREKRNGLTSELSNFGGTLEMNKAEIDEGVYEGLDEDVSKMEKYIGNSKEDTDESMIARILNMEPTLQNNKVILGELKKLKEITKDMKSETVDELLKKTAELKDSLKGYDIKKLEFDYSSLVFKPDQGSPFSIFGTLIQDGMLGLVVDDVDAISKEKIDQKGRPSQLMIEEKKINQEPEKADEESDKLAGDLSEGDNIGYDADITGSLDSYEVSCDNVNIFSNAANGVVENVLLNEYAIEHFKSYTNRTTKKISLETALDFEQEYILCGKDSDYDNIRSVVLRTIFFRTILNYLYLISDSSKSSLAQTTALGLVGFTCLQPLVSITKHLILITWAFEESLIDMRALLDGKQVPLLKNKKNFVLEYTEMLKINKKLIKEKATSMPDKPQGTICFGYDDYMRVYLLLTGKEKKCYRTMDLIQGNIQIRYSEDFQMSHCIYGVRVRAEYIIPSKFVKLPFVDSILNYEGDGFRFEVERDYSY